MNIRSAFPTVLSQLIRTLLAYISGFTLVADPFEQVSSDTIKQSWPLAIIRQASKIHEKTILASTSLQRLCVTWHLPAIAVQSHGCHGRDKILLRDWSSNRRKAVLHGNILCTLPPLPSRHGPALTMRKASL